VYRSVEELPEVLEPGKYVIEGEEIELYEPASRHTIAKMLQLLRRYGREGWV
jgi:hypothetical protein